MFKRILSSSVLLLLMAMQVLAAELTGTVTDKEGLPVPFVTVYVEGTTLGTTTNAEGRYQLELKPGYHIIVFRYVGYGTEIRPVTIEADMKLDVEMKRVVFELGEAVADGSEDPAYRIMRMARGKREFYRQQVQDYSCKVYVKGTNFVKNLPKRVLGRSLDVPGLDATRSGIIYLSESVSEFHFKAPNVTKERVIASKVSGRSEGFTWNNATSLQFNFYDKSYNLEGLSDRNLVSPIAPSATLYYRFKYAGFYIEDSIIVNRIEVIPRATGVPLFKGFIFIQDGSWRIHGVDVFLTSESGIEFVDTVRMKADFIPLTKDLWLKGTLTFDFVFNVKLLKVKGWGTFTSVFSDYSVRKYIKDTDYLNGLQPKLEPDVTEEEKPEAKPKAKDKPKGKEPMNKRSLAKLKEQVENQDSVGGDVTKFDFEEWNKGPLVKVESEANEKDSAFWAEIRTIPLTALEAEDYHRKDSIEVVMKTDAYKDSVDRNSNKFKVQALLYGYTYRDSKRNWSLEVQSPLTAVQFNTVEGYLIDHKLTFNRNGGEDRKTGLIVSYTNRYGFASQQYYGKGSVFYRFNRKNRMRISGEGGHYVRQFQDDGISESINSLYTLLLEENYMKFYEESYGRVGWGMEVFNGVNLSASAYYGQRTTLYNAPRSAIDGQYLNTEGKQYTLNQPTNGQLAYGNSRYGDNRAFKLRIGAKFRPGQKYWEYPDRKINLGSKWPEFSVAYEWGVPTVGGSSSNYSFLQVQVEDDHKIGMAGKLEWAVDAGWFAFNRNVAFADFKHFYTAEVHITPSGLSRFKALPYYMASTDDAYVAAHVEHHFHGAILNKVPLIKKLKWQTVVGAHYLYEPNYGNYWEVTVGIENIFRIIRVDFAFPFRDLQYQQWAFRVQLGF